MRRLMLTDTLNPIGSRFTVGRYLPHMEKTLGFKIEAAKLAKIDALAQTRGGRGPFMRQLVTRCSGSPGRPSRPRLLPTARPLASTAFIFGPPKPNWP